MCVSPTVDFTREGDGARQHHNQQPQRQQGKAQRTAKVLGDGYSPKASDPPALADRGRTEEGDGRQLMCS